MSESILRCIFRFPHYKSGGQTLLITGEYLNSYAPGGRDMRGTDSDQMQIFSFTYYLC